MKKSIEKQTMRERKKKDSLSSSKKSQKKEDYYKKTKLNKIWKVFIYGSFSFIGIFLVYLYSAYIFINK